MKIAFITSSLEPGRDGVGDYTIGFSEELIRAGHEVMAIALRDRFAKQVSESSRQVSGGVVRVLRLPHTLSWPECLRQAQQGLDDFGPEWVSLQFVSYTFHDKGLVYGLDARLAPLIKGCKFSIMFHELWGGAQRGATFKERVMGWLQKKFIVSFIRQSRPLKIHTSNLSYQHLLKRAGFDAGILPLFGNIPIAERSSGWMDAEFNKVGVNHSNRKEFCIFGIFGSIPSEWALEEFLTAAGEVAMKAKRKPLLMTIGAHSAEARQRLEESAKNFSQSMPIVSLGTHSPELISEFLQTIDVGVATAPWCLIGKSGTAMAMLDHGLPILVLRDDVDLNVVEPGHPRCIKMTGDWGEKMWQTPKQSPDSNRPEIVKTFLRDIQAAGAGNN